MKIGLTLCETGYAFTSDERARIYLTNALEVPIDGKQQREFEEGAPTLAQRGPSRQRYQTQQRFTVGDRQQSRKRPRPRRSVIEGFSNERNDRMARLTPLQLGRPARPEAVTGISRMRGRTLIGPGRTLTGRLSSFPWATFAGRVNRSGFSNPVLILG